GKKQKIKVVVRPAVPVNNTHWQVFESDEQIVSFLQNEAEFSERNQSRLQDRSNHPKPYTQFHLKTFLQSMSL
ncbi:hypothetical protein, partial [Enterobacter hormaechei]|uniref:hypothetical protein n=1 Tax=Enterobacter hormaechei TaxID=158836 RepID=UPI0023E457AA